MSGGSPTTLLSFDGINGKNPCGDLLLSGSTLYGMTCKGGANDMGTIFALTIPEPSSIVLLTIGVSSLLARACWRRKLRSKSVVLG